MPEFGEKIIDGRNRTVLFYTQKQGRLPSDCLQRSPLANTDRRPGQAPSSPVVLSITSVREPIDRHWSEFWFDAATEELKSMLFATMTLSSSSTQPCTGHYGLSNQDAKVYAPLEWNSGLSLGVVAPWGSDRSSVKVPADRCRIRRNSDSTAWEVVKGPTEDVLWVSHDSLDGDAPVTGWAPHLLPDQDASNPGTVETMPTFADSNDAIGDATRVAFEAWIDAGESPGSTRRGVYTTNSTSV